jgi:enolase-phosphatase E1
MENVMALSLSAFNIHAILLDIEGTTTPISFVYDVLFPFARSHVKQYLAAHFDQPEVQVDVSYLREEHDTDVSRNLNPPALPAGPGDAVMDSLVAYVHWLMDRDRKSTGLKSLQGKIWQRGYQDGTLRAQVFPDVPPALERWHKDLRVSIFSSGSVLAQELLFAHTEAGDLTPFLARYFDTTTGPKTAADSYRRIATALAVPAAQILFISDVVAELDGARAADMRTLLNLRPGNHPQPATETHPIIETFDEIK